MNRVRNYWLLSLLMVVPLAIATAGSLISDGLGHSVPARAATGGIPANSPLSISPDSLNRPFLPPELVDTMKNAISDPYGHMREFYSKLDELCRGEREKISIVHIGDSHVQAGFLTGRLRQLLQESFGNAGRGLIVPYKIARMNEPRDYSIAPLWLTDHAKATDRGAHSGALTVSVKAQTPAVGFRIWSKDRFDCVTVLHHPDAPALSFPDSLDPGSYCDIFNTDRFTRLVLNAHTDSLLLKGYVSPLYDTPEFYGFSLENGQRGILYHELGLNGAAFDHYIESTDVLFGSLDALEPDLIIVSLGTNNAYGNNYRPDHVDAVADKFIGRLVETYPAAAVLAVTPAESCVRRSVSGRRTYQPNKNISSVAASVRKAADGHGTALWDLYAAMGGDGSNERWHRAALFSRDRIHLTEAGYLLQAEMLYSALTEAFGQYIERRRDE